MNRSLVFVVASSLFPWLVYANASQSERVTAADLIQMDFEDLVNMDVKIQSAGKTATRAMDLPYAAQVITALEIQQSGAQSIPDALRLVPGVNVSQIAAAEWAVGIRGGAGRFSRFVLVMVDGRIAHNTVFSGVNWDELNISMDQIARIEVIRGPNAAAWGANAVNGIINIITRKATDEGSRGVAVWTGSDERMGLASSWTRTLSNHWAVGVAVNAEEWGGLEMEQAKQREAATKNWRGAITLSRDFDEAATHITADLFAMEQAPPWSWVDGTNLQTLYGANAEDKQGWTFQAAHKQALSVNSSWQIRASAEHVARDAYLYDWDSTNYQLDAELTTQLGSHKLATGINTRYNKSVVISSPIFGFNFVPPTREVTNFGVYVSDAVDLTETVQVSLAARLDNSDMSSSNVQPSVRGLWRASENDRFWVAISEATTTPSRALIDIDNVAIELLPSAGVEQPFPVLVRLSGYAEQQKDTRLKAVELGYRRTFSQFSLDVSLFDFHYSNSLGNELVGAPEVVFNEQNIPVYVMQRTRFANNVSYSTAGGEAVIRGQLASYWLSQMSISYVQDRDLSDVSQLSYLFSNHFKLNDVADLSVNLRHVNQSLAPDDRIYLLTFDDNELNDYWAVDANLQWAIHSDWKIEFLVKNLGVKHVETAREQFSAEALLVEPSAQVKLRYSY